MTVVSMNFMALHMHAQTESGDLSNIHGPSVGVGAGHFGDDAGLSVSFTSPSFFDSKLTVRFSPGVQWSEYYFAHASEWTSYATVKTGLVYTIRIIDRSRIYTEAGSFMIFPNRILSAKKQLQGGYGVLGFELFIYTKPAASIGYYFEYGYVGISAYAEKLERNPRYSNGVNISTGFRFYF
jgi:hypothetical protein